MAASKKPELDFHFPLSSMRALLVQMLPPLFAFSASKKSRSGSATAVPAA
jgi:hypothetical protein